ncbi:O-methyltransferase [Mariprofundus ferrooxydans]|uniref:Predicted O-methyltransferase n=1 Tax=Mariprofundus ferrooxydans PV-1 TaxID=314345 RepID=Q0F0T1_9PROT|nr:class I SAM-dependent methyltransferase [Mariprofundus ferrooxydans]EAU55460.1 predicted O-methyltransferase [Mariprofundus ferrooxydans PV-1]KON47631.1 methyltransferase [Mariprofundus ferrooxydans]
MANHTLGLNAALATYVQQVGVREPAILQALRAATEQEELSVMRSAPEQGQLMAMLIRLTGARRILEVGTYTGYATLWMALAMPADGKIISCDLSEAWTNVARRFWEQAEVSDRIDLQLAPALETLDRLLIDGAAGSFDFVFIDADKVNYTAYYERSLELLRVGGLIAIDNTLWGGSVIDPDNQEPSTNAIRAFNNMLYRDSRIDMAMLPLADGLTLASKKGL